MKVSTSNVLRMAAAIFLGAALLMLILGQTLFSQRLSKAGFALYWLTCFLFTGAAAITALIDMALLRQKLRREQRDLIKSTLAESQTDPTQKSS